MRLALAALCILACDSPGAPAGDAPSEDATVDAGEGALVDASDPDAQIDAPVVDAGPSTSPRCTTAPSVLLDVSPKVIGSMAGAGNYLYVSAYTYSPTAPPANAEIFTIDLTTGQQVGAPHATAAPVGLHGSSGVVLGGDYAADGAVWRIEPGQAPVTILDHVPIPGPAIIDDGYLYWTENAWMSTNGIIKRRPVAGGAAESVLACNDPVKLLVDGATIYCVGSSRTFRGLKVGGSLPEYIQLPNSGFFTVSAVLAEDTIFYLQYSGRLSAQPLVGTAATTVHQAMPGARYLGLAAAPDVFYVTDGERGMWRVDRATYTADRIVPALSLAGDAVLWNDHLYYQAPNPQLPFTSYVMECVN